jgi:outer membrane protein
MKKIVLFGMIAMSVLGFTNTTNAQGKIGYINTEELMGSMPESEKASKDLNEYQNLLQQQNNDLIKELNEKDSLFVKDSSRLSEVQKKFRRDELIKLYQEVQGFSQKAQETLQQRQQELLIPIRNKAMDGIKAVAKESGYAYIIDNASGMILVAPPGDDVLALVKKKLGIKDPAPAAPAGGKPPVRAGGN